MKKVCMDSLIVFQLLGEHQPPVSGTGIASVSDEGGVVTLFIFVECGKVTGSRGRRWLKTCRHWSRVAPGLDL